MEIICYRTDVWSGHGCYWIGDLAVFDYEEYMKSLPKHGKFGAMTCLDALDEAKRIAKELYGDVEILLSIPILVVRLPGE